MSDNVNFKYHAFISYRNVAPYCARSIYYALSAMGYNVFFDKENLGGGNYTNQIEPAIKNCDYFLLVLTKNTFDGRDPTKDYLLKEIDLAKKTIKDDHIIPLCIDGFDIQKDLPDSLKWLADLQKHDIRHEEFAQNIRELVGPRFFKDIDLSKQHLYKRVANNSYKKRTAESTVKELGRLSTQSEIYEQWDGPVFNETVSRYPNGFVSLDVGCANGVRGMHYLGSSDKCKKHIGIDYNLDFLAEAKKLYGDKALFYEVNIEDMDFVQKMQNIMKENNINGFDIINVSLVLLHIEQPCKLIERLHTLLNPGGTIVIIDLDDGYNIAFPDDDKAFERVCQICYDVPRTGHRHTGREIYTYLKQNNYEHINLKKDIISTNNWSKEMKAALFDGRIGLVKRVLVKTLNQYKDDPTKLTEYKHFSQEQEWLESVFPKLEREFMADTFFYTCSHIIYTAEKSLDAPTEKRPVKFW